MRDHKLALFKAREDDLAIQLADRDAQLEELEVGFLDSALQEGALILGVLVASQHLSCAPASRRQEIQLRIIFATMQD